jgi:hypothetical protein
MSLVLLLVVLVNLLHLNDACRCFVPPEEPVELLVLSKPPHTYLKSSDIPAAWDWRNVNGTNYCSKVLTQQNPSVCGSCWAEAATGLTLLILPSFSAKNNLSFRCFI